MKTVTLHGTLVLLLYLKISSGQQTLANNQNNVIGLQQPPVNWPQNQFQNGGPNINLQQAANLQQNPNLRSLNQGNTQSLNLQQNSQSQSASGSPNSLQITKMSFTPVSQVNPNNPYSSQVQVQNGGVKPTVQVIQSQNTPILNPSGSQISNAPISISTLAELMALKGQPSLLSLFNPSNNCQSQQSQQTISPNIIPVQNQLTDAQKQHLVRAIQNQNPGQNQHGINIIQVQPRTDNQQTVAYQAIQGAPQHTQAIVTPLGNQPSYITVQAHPLTTYLQQPQQVTVEEEPSIISLILSELGSQYSGDSSYISPKKGSKPNMKTLIPLIINMLKEKNSCQNCGCPNTCENGWPNAVVESQMAQIFGGYSNQKKYGQGSDSTPTRIKKNDDEESRQNDKTRKNNKNNVKEESEEFSEEDDSDYVDD